MVDTVEDYIATLLPPPRRPPTFLGRSKYLLVHEPASWLRQGVRYRWRGFAAERKLREFINSGRLRVEKTVGPNMLEPVNYLVGMKYVYLAILSAASLRQNVDQSCEIRFFDDGSLTQPAIRLINDCLPGATVVPLAEWELSGKSRMAKLKFINRIRNTYPHIGKLLLHASIEGFNNLSDSDVLYFNSCDQIAMLNQNNSAFFMNDKVEMYGASRVDLEKYAPILPHKVNAGCYGLKSSDIVFDEIDRVAIKFVENHGFHYVLEQFLTAYALGQQNARPLGPTFAMAAYENHEFGPPQMLHYANCLPALYNDALRIFPA